MRKNKIGKTLVNKAITLAWRVGKLYLRLYSNEETGYGETLNPKVKTIIEENLDLERYEPENVPRTVNIKTMTASNRLLAAHVLNLIEHLNDITAQMKNRMGTDEFEEVWSEPELAELWEVLSALFADN